MNKSPMGKPTHPLAAAAKEFELAVDWGMAPADALRARTIAGASMLGIASETGSLVAGSAPTASPFSGNPPVDIAALHRPSLVMRDGQRFR
jgi:imidazolonepropionase-like amidohydrolase